MEGSPSAWRQWRGEGSAKLTPRGVEIRRYPSSPNNREIVEDQLSEIDRMDALLSDLLLLARLDSGRLEVEKKPFDLAVVASEAAERFLEPSTAGRCSSSPPGLVNAIEGVSSKSLGIRCCYHMFWATSIRSYRQKERRRS